MGRRGFGFSSLNRLSASIRAAENRRERDLLIQKQSGLQKELSPVYTLFNVDFNEETRSTTVTIRCTKHYRTIERYVTQNYQRYPIYSSWKTKETYIDKKLKLTNTTLERLNINEDYLVSKFADEIVLSLNNPDLVPSWLAKKIILNECEELTSVEKNKKDGLKKEFDIFVSKQNNTIHLHKKEIESINLEKRKIDKIIEKRNKQISKIDVHKPRIIILIFTVGFNHLLYTKSRREKLSKNRDNLQEISNAKKESIDNIKLNIEKIEEYKNIEKEKYLEKVENIEKTIASIREDCNDRLKTVQKLPTTYKPDLSFVPLKDFMGFDYEKIIGCYVIQNTENEKVYVGQSKDVMRRIRQHFKGTTPNNVIFAEDYYLCPKDKRDNLFKIKIQHLHTKDELDRTEKQLIEEYGANIHGYNSTKGNI